MKVLITGGHLSPALCLIEELEKEEIVFVGRKYAIEGEKSLSFEYKIINEFKIPFIPIKTGRLQRRLTRHTIPSLLKVPIGLINAIKILRKEKPDIVMSFGGYVSVPVVIAASMLKIPSVIHEQTFKSGLSNKIASKFAKKVLISWKESEKYFPKKKIILVGNPVRSEVLNLKKGTPNSFPRIFVGGGSLGSHKLNQLVEKSLIKLTKICEVTHQTGSSTEFNDYERLLRKKNELGEYKSRYEVKEHFYPKDYIEQLNKNDLFVSRSGINSVSEYLAIQKPCFLIPLVTGQRNEQLENARFIQNMGLAEVKIDPSEEEFLNTIEYMLKNISKYKLEKDVIVKDSAKKIASILRETANA